MAPRPLAALVPVQLLLLCFLSLCSGAMPPGAGLCTDPASTGPQLLVGGKPSDPRLLPAGIGRYMIYVKEGAEKRAAVQAALKEHMGSSYKEANVLKIIPMFVAEIEKDKLVELLTSDSFQSVRELMGGCVTIEPDGVVSIPEQPGDMTRSGLPSSREELR